MVLQYFMEKSKILKILYIIITNYDTQTIFYNYKEKTKLLNNFKNLRIKLKTNISERMCIKQVVQNITFKTSQQLC